MNNSSQAITGKSSFVNGEWKRVASCQIMLHSPMIAFLLTSTSAYCSADVHNIGDQMPTHLISNSSNGLSTEFSIGPEYTKLIDLISCAKETYNPAYQTVSQQVNVAGRLAQGKQTWEIYQVKLHPTHCNVYID